jgi:group I intron endonuclease
VENNKKYIVYMHISPSGKKYIGITSQTPEKRWHKDGSGYKEQIYFWRAIQKYGWDNFQHKILLKDETFEYACKIEKCLIRHYKTYDDRYGYNLTLGGEGRLLTDEQKEQLSQQRQGVNACGYGNFPSKETKKKMSEVAKNKIFNQTTKEKMANSKKKPVYQYNFDGELINMFNSASEGAIATETNIGNLCACCRNVVKQANGYFWSYSYIADPNVIKQYLSGQIDFSIIKTRNEKQVVQMDLDCNELKLFPSLKEASNETGIPAQEISQACKNQNKVTREFKWKFNTDTLNNNFEIVEQKSKPCLYGKQKPLVYYRSDRKRWVSYIMQDGKKKTIRTCQTEEEAINSYFEYVKKDVDELHGD